MIEASVFVISCHHVKSHIQLNHYISAQNKFPFGIMKILNYNLIKLICILDPCTSAFLNVAVIALPRYIIRGSEDDGDDCPFFCFLGGDIFLLLHKGKVPSGPVYSLLYIGLEREGIGPVLERTV